MQGSELPHWSRRGSSKGPKDEGEGDEVSERYWAFFVDEAIARAHDEANGKVDK